MSEDPTRPVSVAELLARNGTIGSPPVGGHRRRKRRNGVSVAELTGEIPVIRTGEIPVVADYESDDVDQSDAFDEAADVTSETVVVYSSAGSSYAVDETSYVDDTPADAVPDYSDYQDYTPGYDETPARDEAAALVDTASYTETSYTEISYTEARVEPAAAFPAAEPEVVYDEVADQEIDAGRPPLSSIPLPRRRRGPELSHDPRPRRRSSGPEPAGPAARRTSGAEQMSPDPVDGSVDLAELVAEQAPDPADLRSYLKSSSGTLFFGETVADDLARRGEVTDSDLDDDYGRYDDGDDDGDTVAADADYERIDVDDDVDAPRPGRLKVLGTSLVAVAQSLLAVVFGAGLFIGFDQLWRWNNIVALALSALVITALMIGVHVVRKTEDFVSTLIAALVGILVTFGPLALQST